MLSLRGPRLALLGALVVVATAAGPMPASAAADDDMEAAQRRANRAADELAEAQEQLAKASDAVTRLEARVSRIDSEVSAVRDQVRQLAIRLYVEGTSPLARILRLGDSGDVVRAQQYSRLVAGASTDSLGQYRAEREDLRKELAALEREKGARAGATDNLRRRQTEAARELDRLTRVVEQTRAAMEEQRRAQARARTAAAAP
ncbi:MAG TPA: hypothetical protein VHH09_06075, partial [Acidimicrobiales bacterium]|nr:hypothetical protein [Acidimicrobiales bacterium]